MKRRARRWGVAAAALMSAVFMGAGVTHALTPTPDAGSSGPIVACVTNSGGVLRVVTAAFQCKRSEHPVYLQQAVANGQTGFTVDCAAGQHIGDVLDQVAAATVPVSITVIGTCTEQVQIDRDNVSISVSMGPSGQGGITAPAADSAPITIAGRNIRIGGLTLTGGQNGIHARAGSSFTSGGTTITGADTGVLLEQGVTATMDGLTVRDSTSTGIEMQEGSTLSAGQLTVTGSGFTGVHVWANSTATINGRISGNAHGGVIVQDGSVAIISAEISNNAVGGVTSMEGSHVDISHSAIHNNDYWGVSVDGGSSAHFGGGNVISNNAGDGVSIADVSVAKFDTAADTATDRVIDNAGYGVSCVGPVAMITAAPATLTGNGSGDLNCRVGG